jgi:hypothetical protein
MSDRLFFASAAVLAALLIGLAFLWPQGAGRKSPGPFGKAEEISAAARQDLDAEAREKAKKAQLRAPAPAAAPAAIAGASK